MLATPARLKRLLLVMGTLAVLNLLSYSDCVQAHVRFCAREEREVKVRGSCTGEQVSLGGGEQALEGELRQVQIEL